MHISSVILSQKKEEEIMPKVMLRKIYIIALQILISIAALICVDSGYADVIDSRTSGVAPLGIEIK